MIVLAVDTSSHHASIALQSGDRLLAELRCGGEALHSTKVLPRIEFLLRDQGLAPERVDGLAAVAGPGSYTGLRIGLGTVQGLALGWGKPCLGLSALLLMARRARDSGPIVAVRDAWRGELYVAFHDAEARPCGDVEVLTPEALRNRVQPGTIVTGDGMELARPALAGADVRFVARSPFLARELAAAAAEAFAAGHAGTAGELRPVYARPAAVAASR
ncbi:MAG: tRNA (adenosine(37)-N6)-threonylcarbamoyltransferase complex dimerization subunit type 1 TsaB [Vicinamibacteria bacterium]|nr:tRNA (adenosine(37)-N6)-threonylcarbamoyltransferase complex dimerization subunit type 1 TsaB [Vicinamibacteria bacterium]